MDKVYPPLVCNNSRGQSQIQYKLVMHTPLPSQLESYSILSFLFEDSMI